LHDADHLAARGLASSSSALGLSVGERFKRKIIVSLQLEDRAPLPSLRDRVSTYDAGVENGIEPSFERKLAKFVEDQVKDLYCTATTGRDQSGDVCAGIVVVARLKNGDTQYAASFFVLTHQGFLDCVDPVSNIEQVEGAAWPQVAWIIAHERPELYFLRVCKHVPESRDPFYAMSRTGTAIEREEI